MKLYATFVICDFQLIAEPMIRSQTLGFSVDRKGAGMDSISDFAIFNCRRINDSFSKLVIFNSYFAMFSWPQKQGFVLKPYHFQLTAEFKDPISDLVVFSWPDSILDFAIFSWPQNQGFVLKPCDFRFTAEPRIRSQDSISDLVIFNWPRRTYNGMAISGFITYPQKHSNEFYLSVKQQLSKNTQPSFSNWSC